MKVLFAAYARGVATEQTPVAIAKDDIPPLKFQLVPLALSE